MSNNILNAGIGDVIKLNGELLEITEITPHQEIKNAKYYKFNTGYVERDIRLHPEAIYIRVKLEKA